MATPANSRSLPDRPEGARAVLMEATGLLQRIRSALRIRRGIHSEGVYYKELSAEPLDVQRAHKDYRATFADGSKMYLRCSARRCYADLMGPAGMSRYERAVPILRPGSRVLEIASEPATTGYSGAWLAQTVGGSGAVVSVILDAEGARFARNRYDGIPNLSIETGPVLDALTGETNGAFGTVIDLGLPTDAAERDKRMHELWRVLAVYGWLLVGVRTHDDPSDAAMVELKRRLAALGDRAERTDTPTGPVFDVLLRKDPDAPAAF